ncbi:hypothetical protein BET10_19160 [Pseudoalteromonas amylolytica]|uniref:Uncharacterized protein n=1 Tax=Pseudoalteromonas amylolytica TaxID=1859457 RepID=A0A1S1MMD1_9GAMM|nr:hypothetical protein BET10_19160 [Pseudoalteromonas amylolytica]
MIVEEIKIKQMLISAQKIWHAKTCISTFIINYLNLFTKTGEKEVEKYSINTLMSLLTFKKLPIIVALITI